MTSFAGWLISAVGPSSLDLSTAAIAAASVAVTAVGPLGFSLGLHFSQRWISLSHLDSDLKCFVKFECPSLYSLYRQLAHCFPKN